jgi:hypothetical protein
MPSVGPPIERRAMLLGGAAAAAGVAAAQVAPVRAAAARAVALPARLDAPSRAMQVGSSTTASDVSFVPTGEFDAASTNVQAALQELDGRLTKLHVVDDLQSSIVLVDDFMGGIPTSGSIGELGWAFTSLGTAGAALGNVGAPGVLTLHTGQNPLLWAHVDLGTGVLNGLPELTCEFRLKFNAVNTGTGNLDPFRAFFGLHDGTTDAEPANGLYFRYRNSGTKTWEAVCANAGGRDSNPVVDTGLDASSDPLYRALDYHRFRITCTRRGAYATVQFAIDGYPAKTFTNDPLDLDPTHVHTTYLPFSAFFSPAMTIYKVNGSAQRQVHIDYFALRIDRTQS